MMTKKAKQRFVEEMNRQFKYEPSYECVTVINPKTKIKIGWSIDRYLPDEDKRDIIYNKVVII
nr:MAG TPA: hypothetical protein [Herelleviridae sp.]